MEALSCSFIVNTEERREGEEGRRLMMRRIEEEMLISDRLLFEAMTALHI